MAAISGDNELFDNDLVIITRNNKVRKKHFFSVRRSLPYRAIARRAINSNTKIEYDTEIDISAMVLAP